MLVRIAVSSVPILHLFGLPVRLNTVSSKGRSCANQGEFANLRRNLRMCGGICGCAEYERIRDFAIFEQKKALGICTKMGVETGPRWPPQENMISPS
eukprot:s255_g19.t1